MQHLTGQRKPIECANRPAGRVYHILLPAGKEDFFMKIIEIEKRGMKIRITIPKIDEDTWICFIFAAMAVSIFAIVASSI